MIENLQTDSIKSKLSPVWRNPATGLDKNLTEYKE